jgi:hypothetical protein
MGFNLTLDVRIKRITSRLRQEWSAAMDEQRRRLLNAGAGALLAGMSTAAPANSAPGSGAGSRPGAPGDFNFLDGEWRIHHQRLRDGSWDAFDGEATCFTILAGACSIEELRIPARDFSGMGIRILDVPNRTWREHWVNARSGVIEGSGVAGGFIDGAAVFESEEQDGDQPIRVRSTWDEVSTSGCRWRQSVSRDAGRSWEDNWIMRWNRA